MFQHDKPVFFKYTIRPLKMQYINLVRVMSVLRLLPVKHGELCVPSVYCNFKQAISVSFVIATYAT